MSENSVFIICVTILFILTIGEPDIIDGAIAILNKG